MEEVSTFVFVVDRPLGDFILSWPAIISLKIKFPRLHFIGVGNPDHMALAQNMGVFHSFVPENSSEAGSLLNGEVRISAFGKIKYLICWGRLKQSTIKSQRFLEYKLTKRFAHFSIGFTRNKNLHAIDYFYQDVSFFIKNAGFDPSAMAFVNSHNFLCQTKRNNDGYALVHLGSAAVGKVYHPDVYPKIRDALYDFGISDVRIVIGPKEFNVRRQLGNAYKYEAPLSCTDLATLINRAVIYIGADNGPCHLAGLLGIPTISLHIYDNLSQWRVRGPIVRNIVARDETSVLKGIRNALYNEFVCEYSTGRVVHFRAIDEYDGSIDPPQTNRLVGYYNGSETNP